MSIELMLNGVNLSFVAFAAQWPCAQRAGFRVLRDGRGCREAAVGLAIII